MPVERGGDEQPWLRIRAVVDSKGHPFEVRAVVSGRDLRRVRSTRLIDEFIVEALATLGQRIFRFVRGARPPRGGFSVGVVAMGSIEERVIDQEWIARESDVDASVEKFARRVEAGDYSAR